MFYTYILKSLRDKRYYYGSTQDLSNRLLEHNKGKVSATKNRLPLVIHYFEKHQTRKEAVHREYFFKKRSGYKWLKDNKVI